jgi:hypothetical protein
MGHVRFTSESGHLQCNSPCPLWAKSGHSVMSEVREAHCAHPRAFVLPGRPGCAPTQETETEARRRVHLARGVGCGGGRLADGCGAGVLGQWRQHSQQAPRRLTGHGAVFVTPRVAADRFGHHSEE